MSAQWRDDVAAPADAGPGDPTAAEGPLPEPLLEPLPEPGHATPRSGDDAIDADVAALTAAAPGPLPHVVDAAERLHQTIQRRLAERGDA